MTPTVARSLAEESQEVLPLPVSKDNGSAAVVTVGAAGLIEDCNVAFELTFGFLRHELCGCDISSLLPKLADIALIKDGAANPRLRFLCRAGARFEVMSNTGCRVPCELLISDLSRLGRTRLRITVMPSSEENSCLLTPQRRSV